MTEREQTTNEQDDGFRPIPDGGLSATLPEWLKERPSWSQDAAQRAKLEPDTSPIDPRILLRDEDLPEWLLAISNRVPVGDIRDADVSKSTDVQPSGDTTPGKPEWMTHVEAEPVIPAGPDPDVRSWLSGGETYEKRRELWRDPYVLVFVIAALIIVAGTLVLLFR